MSDKLLKAFNRVVKEYVKQRISIYELDMKLYAIRYYEKIERKQ